MHRGFVANSCGRPGDIADQPAIAGFAAPQRHPSWCGGRPPLTGGGGAPVSAAVGQPSAVPTGDRAPAGWEKRISAFSRPAPITLISPQRDRGCGMTPSFMQGAEASNVGLPPESACFDHASSQPSGATGLSGGRCLPLRSKMQIRTTSREFWSPREQFGSCPRNLIAPRIDYLPPMVPRIKVAPKGVDVATGRARGSVCPLIIGNIDASSRVSSNSPRLPCNPPFSWVEKK